MVPALDESIAKAKRLLGGMNDETLLQTWRIVDGDREILALPRVAFLRSIMLNHWYHHRGQLSSLSTHPERAGAVDLRPERRRESVRVTRSSTEEGV